MAIYTRFGMPVQIVAAERRLRWWISYGGRTEIFDATPTDKQKRGAKEIDEFDLWWIKAKCAGPYPDGSSADMIGKMIDGFDDRGFRDETEFRADDGIREIHNACEAVAKVFA